MPHSPESVSYVIRLEHRCWKAPWPGDPGRTTQFLKAQRFATKNAARTSLGMARRYQPFKGAQILRVPDVG